jgi:uncharacterized membrane protein YphA (DoxX/SURF4 family)
MTVATWILSLLLVAEFVMAPINLWTGRTMANFTTFTGYPPRIARRVFAPVKIAAAAFVAVGLVLRPFGIAGAAFTVTIFLLYLVRLAGRGRRDRAGIAGFSTFGMLALALLVSQIVR